MAHPCWTLEACAFHTRGGTPPAPDHDATVSARQGRIEKEKQRLIEYAAEYGDLRAVLTRFPSDTEGGEHRVFHLVHAKRYFKATLTSKQQGYGIALGSWQHGATPSEYLDRLYLHNFIFNDDVRLEYVVNNYGFPIIVTSQPAIIGEHPSQHVIDRVMVDAMGFEKMAEGAYYAADKGLLLYDLFPRNVYMNSDGQMLPVDPVIQRIDTEFADFLRCAPYTINLRG